MSDDERAPALPAVAPPKPLRTRHDGPSTGSGCTEPAKPRMRHDGFTPKKQKRFFKTLRKTGCIIDACRRAGISRQTVRRHRLKWPAFEAKVQEALAEGATELEAIAWQRATVGAERKLYRDGRLIAVTVKPSDAMLRLLMQGANPAKYGRTGQLPKGAALERLRKEALKAARAELRAARPDPEASMARFMDGIGRIQEQDRAAKLRHGYREGPEGLLVPPGWRLVRDESAALPPPDADDQDSFPES